MTAFWSCHLIVNRNLDDRRYVHDFIDADFSHWEDSSTLFLKWLPSTNANIFSRCYAHFGKTLNISTDNDFTFTVDEPIAYHLEDSRVPRRDPRLGLSPQSHSW